MKYCIDCKWFKRSWLDLSDSKCLHPDATVCVLNKFLSRRMAKTEQETARIQRGYGKCGADGRNWDPKKIGAFHNE
jgi:hypothetical protein